MLQKTTNQKPEFSNFKKTILMRGYLSILFFFIFITPQIFGQSFLQLEKRGSFKTERYYVGDVLIFQLEGSEDWYVEEILEIMIDEKLVLFENRVVEISTITKLRHSEKGQVWRGIGNKIMIFGASFLGISLIASIPDSFDWELKEDTWIISGSALATGGLIRLIFSSRSYKLGKRRWLRPMNTDFAPPGKV